MNFDEYVKQFEWIQPIVFVCRHCSEEFMILKGGMKGQELKVPKLCVYCGTPGSLGGPKPNEVN